MIIFIVSNFQMYKKGEGSYFIRSSTKWCAKLWIIYGEGGEERVKSFDAKKNNILNMSHRVIKVNE
jgi:hypothetical protein